MEYIESTQKERIISGLLYVTFLIPYINLFLSLFSIFFIDNFYAKKSNFSKMHVSEAGLLWILHILGSVFLYLVYNPMNYNILMGEMMVFTLIMTITIFLYSVVLVILSLFMAVKAFQGKCYKLSAKFIFLRKINLGQEMRFIVKISFIAIIFILAVLVS